MSEDNKAPEELSEKDIDALNKDIDNATQSLVSKETQSAIDKAKQEAKQEAEKEFATNQKIKELEKEKEELASKLQEGEKKSAEELEKIKSKVNELVSSKAVVDKGNPFAGPGPSGPTSGNEAAQSLSDEQVNDIEMASYEEFISQRVRKD